MNIVILAAGMGKRMRSKLPKVLQPLAGRPLLSHVIATARKLAPQRLIVVIGHGGDAVREAVAGEGIAFAEQAQQLGTGHAVQQAAPLLDESAPTLVLYGDVPLTRAETLQALLEAAGRDKLGVLTVDLENPSGYGRIVRDAAGNVQRIVEQKDANEAERAIREINTGILVAPTRALKGWLGGLKNQNAQGEYYLTDVIACAVADGVPVVTTQPAFAWEPNGVNDKAQLAELERDYQRNAAGALLAAGVTLVDPARFDVRGEMTCGTDVTIDVNCVFEGKVTIGDGAFIGANCVIRNSTIGAGTRIEAFSHLDGAVVGRDAHVGPYARLRPGADLGDEVHIGNFVEVKNASLAKGSKANHLAYVGDSTVGERVNIGAGTITCNYDGANKHRTVIEDDVFVGSDTQLVAPVTVRRGTTIAAGTTVWKDTPEGALVLNGKTQVAKEGYVRPRKQKR
ncbi:bifunctional UDP-N-acetylglucosamine diphosphorylase/glucosamine-1-phosphate N-acetyltransferase GlmU [Pandoraea nosoerga]|uniref:Bifunctional protein GlmU n=1 Tax=Pandoraea nosoerga TaxID=2508296 RepID=A0A5E4S1W0_9BURK|nr:MULTISPECIES: bifunctional UDP-N-acetylglucosamine diphosphorylase/glucosamine-1-phosphate N-acetyltransferase GlmU [Pandoraea]MBN4667678.1 bifunctional UDP-N-acetylglucosamine diphosphorylase/glucosamine-1-phosphate N-acetyltransferase GlmU [Pandoraea nosoerga]MBN4676630.1 bifunctional UDP-N-acetylglucosamine diphosphorylase/glucosamine-1-phosphate N-acetyltransferase GlmU [Pandoraea nosoerga]MBN4683078.1 bifunctional UDP-N-acetylglucosamine diphosphorylase/glucosamine-1-phosphate N-acetyltr